MTTLADIQRKVGVPADGKLGPVTIAAIAKALRMAEPAPTDAFDAALDIVLQHEGGFSNHSRDPGGMTNLGITRRTLESWLGRLPSEAEMRGLTREAVAPIYRKNYWDALRCDELPPALALCVFDFGVNAGPARAARLLQGVVGTAVDGKIGPATIAAAKSFGVPTLVRAYQDGRRTYYRGLSTFNTFGKGWLRRVDAVETAALRLA
jgi:lysozyme family protein